MRVVIMEVAVLLLPSFYVLMTTNDIVMKIIIVLL